ncbi:MAG: hypothetical protein MJ252_07295, partial [archaeon]|nr:hypothetical protein [archaeon]
MYDYKKLKEEHSKYIREYLNEYYNSAPLLRKMINDSKSKKKKKIIIDLDYNGITARVKNYFIDRQIKLMELIGDDKDNYDEVLDYNEVKEENEKDVARKNRKFAFVDPKTNIDRYKKHLNEIEQINEKNYENNNMPVNPLNRRFLLNRKVKEKEITLPRLERNKSMGILSNDNFVQTGIKLSGY